MLERPSHITDQINRKLIELESHLVAARKLRGRIDSRVRALVALVADKRKHLAAAKSLLADLAQLEKRARASQHETQSKGRAR